PHRIDGLLSSRWNAVVTAIPLIRAIGNVIRPFQFGKLNVLGWNVLNGRIPRFAERQGVASIDNDTAHDGHDNASGVAFDGNRMIWTWKLDLPFLHVSVSPFCSCLALQELRDVLNHNLEVADKMDRTMNHRVAAQRRDSRCSRGNRKCRTSCGRNR